jgi:hypothetical protein
MQTPVAPLHYRLAGPDEDRLPPDEDSSLFGQSSRYPQAATGTDTAPPMLAVPEDQPVLPPPPPRLHHGASGVHEDAAQASKSSVPVSESVSRAITAKAVSDVHERLNHMDSAIRQQGIVLDQVLALLRGTSSGPRHKREPSAAALRQHALGLTRVDELGMDETLAAESAVESPGSFGSTPGLDGSPSHPRRPKPQLQHQSSYRTGFLARSTVMRTGSNSMFAGNNEPLRPASPQLWIDVDANVSDTSSEDELVAAKRPVRE